MFLYRVLSYLSVSCDGSCYFVHATLTGTTFGSGLSKSLAQGQHYIHEWVLTTFLCCRPATDDGWTGDERGVVRWTRRVPFLDGTRRKIAANELGERSLVLALPRARFWRTIPSSGRTQDTSEADGGVSDDVVRCGVIGHMQLRPRTFIDRNLKEPLHMHVLKLYRTH